MSNLNTVIKAPLSRSYIAPENVRKDTVHEPSAIALLAGSIRHFGKVLEPLKAYIDADDRLAVWDGGRRYTALGVIEADGDGVGRVITDAVDFFITTQEEARAASLATFVREDQHPADQFLAYNGMFDEGMSAEQIAAAFAVETKTVNQLLRFRTLSPRVLEAFRAGRFGLDVAYAFTLTTDHDKQHALLDATGDKAFSPYSIKNALTAGAVTARDQWAQFIGRDAYEAAGGTFLMDLFSNHSADEQWSNGDLVRELAQAKLTTMEQEFLAEGWSKVIVHTRGYGWQDGYVAMKAEGTAKKNKPKPFTPEQMKRGVVFIVFGYNGVEVKPGYEKASKGANAFAQPKPDQTLFGFGHKGHHVLTQVASDATKVALATNYQAAADALLATLAWSVLRKPKYGHAGTSLASNLHVDDRFTSRPEHTAVAGYDDLEPALDAWKAIAPTTMIAFCEWVASLAPDVKLRLQAECFAATIDGAEIEIRQNPSDRQRHLGWMARHAGVTLGRDVWEPDETFLKGGSKDALIDATSQITGVPGRDGKKGDLVKNVVRLVQENGWTPKRLATFMDVTDPEPDPSKASDDDRDAASETEYLGWIAEALINDHDMTAAQAEAAAPLALARELEGTEAVFGDDSYNWSRTDADCSATDYASHLLVADETEEA